jgi:osmotically-inducible protein OsmY
MTDKELKRHVDAALNREPSIAAADLGTSVHSRIVSVAVSDGWVTLTGKVDWSFQKDAAARVVREVAGVQGVTNEIGVLPHVCVSEVQAKIEAAFKRSAEIDARRISVTARDGKVILTGNVRSWAERQEAERAASAAPGVTQVDDRLSVMP